MNVLQRTAEWLHNPAPWRWKESRGPWWVLPCAWLVCVTAGLTLLWHYDWTPGEAGKPIARWPANSSIALSPQTPTLVMFIHPQCPCSRASLAELKRIVTPNPGRVNVQLLFFLPADADPQWAHTDVYETAQTIPGAHVQLDKANAEARRFGAKTSGYTLLYDPAGHLLFSGGITQGRGHIGDNEGCRAVAALLSGERPEVENTKVFGCPLTNTEPSE
jgi:hypothetical protein